MLINLTNHPSSLWDKKQISLAEEQYNTVLDIPFPFVAPDFTFEQITELADLYFQKIKKLIDSAEGENNVVHLMGEFTFTYTLLNLLRTSNIEAVASTTSRSVIVENGEKISKFDFVFFRRYY